MAKPDTEDGWIPYAHELDAALAAADFSKGAKIVLREVFSQTFGLSKHRTAILSPSEIGGRVGVMKEHIVKAITMLVACKVLVRVGRGEYRFVKDYEKWTFPDGSPRLTKTEISWCLSAPYVAKAHAKPRKNVLNTGAQLVPENGCLGAQLVPESDDLRSAVGSRNGVGTIGARASEEFEIREDVDDDSRMLEGTEPNAIRSPEHAATVALAQQLFGEEQAATVTQMGCDIERSLGGRWDCYRAAMTRAKKSSKTIDNLHAYCIRTGGQFAATGIPPEPVAFTPKGGASKATDFVKAPTGYAEHIAGKKKGTR